MNTIEDNDDCNVAFHFWFISLRFTRLNQARRRLFGLFFCFSRRVAEAPFPKGHISKRRAKGQKRHAHNKKKRLKKKEHNKNRTQEFYVATH
jgi:hypothetical protein